jgi:hypothetical protein
MRVTVGRGLLVTSLLLLHAAAGAGEPSIEVTPVLGLRGGATVDADPPETGRAEADPSLSFGLVLDFPVRSDARIEVFFDRQELEFEGDPEPFDVTIDYLHAGGVYEPDRGRHRPFVAASLGLSRVDADGARVDDDLSLSGSLGGGTKIALGERLALRLELRGYATFSDGAVQATCGPGCTVNLQTEGWYQLAGRVGLVFRVGGKGSGAP